jgi:hypothetical protein
MDMDLNFKIPILVYVEKLRCNEAKPNQKDVECAICLEKILPSQQYTTKCAHFYCISCILAWIESQHHIGQSRTCPFCRKSIEEEIIPFQLEFFYDRYFEEVDPIDFGNKLLAVISNLYPVCCNNEFWINFTTIETPLKDVELNIEKFLANALPKFAQVEEESENNEEKHRMLSLVLQSFWQRLSQSSHKLKKRVKTMKKSIGC